MVKGALLGQIQFCQEMLGLTISPLAELEPLDVAVLQDLQPELEARLRQHLQ